MQRIRYNFRQYNTVQEETKQKKNRDLQKRPNTIHDNALT